MAQKRLRSKHRFWRICRLYFRRFRLLVWSIILLLLGGILYVNQVGLPEVIKNPLLEKVRDRGIDLRFTRLRFRFVEGVVAENVRFGDPNDPAGPHLNVSKVRVQLNDHALIRGRLQVDGLWLRQGELIWPVEGTNGKPQDLRIERIDSQLRFLPNDQWALDDFSGIFAGANFRLSGIVTNASHVREWMFLKPKKGEKPAQPGEFERKLRKLADVLQQVRFLSPPELKFDVTGDARDLLSFKARLSIAAEGAETPWGRFSRGRFAALMLPLSNGISRAEINLVAAGSETPWASARDLQLKAVLVSMQGQSNLVSGSLELETAQAQTRWCSSSNLVLTTTWVHAVTNPVPLSGTAHIKADEISSTWGQAGKCDLAGTFRNFAADGGCVTPKPGWGWWTNIAGYGVQFTFNGWDLAAQELHAERASVSGKWECGALNVSNLTARLYGADLMARGQLDVETRKAGVSLSTDLDAHRIAPLLGDKAQRWISQFTWERAPKLEGEVELVLPAWTNRHPNWQAEVLPALKISGEFGLNGPGSYRGIAVSSARSSLNYSNRCWHLPDLTLTRPEGRVQAEYRENDRTKDFYARIQSTVDPAAIRPVLKPREQKAFDLLALSQPPRIEGEIWGRHHAPELTGFRGRLWLTNFSFREQWASSLQTGVEFTNKILRCVQPRITRDAERAEAEGLAADFDEQKVFLTNATSTFEPMIIARAIGPAPARAIAAYQFEKPPRVRVYGTIPMHGEEGADLHFEIEGEKFHWWKFNLDRMAGHVHWGGLKVALRNVRAGFYQGEATGFADFDFTRKQGTDFQFTATVTNSLLQFLIADLSTGSNQPEGVLNAWVTVTRANTADWRTVDGYGSAELRDGLIWDIPIFGKLSPVLNGINPGLGNSRATAGTCTFSITNGVVRTDDLQFQCQGTRVQYRGTVDLETRLDARVEAELLRNMWLVGPLVSTMFWPVTKMFEYRLTGTLAEPQLDPIYIFPKLMLMPFHPLRTLKNLFPDDDSSRSNSPPEFPNGTP